MRRMRRCSGIVVWMPSMMNMSSARDMRDDGFGRGRVPRTMSLAIIES